MLSAMVSEIDGDAADSRERTGVQSLGPAAILTQNPESRPLKTKRSPAPTVQAVSRAVRRELRNACSLFVAAYHSTVESPPRNSAPGNETPPFPRTSSRRRCRSSADSRRIAVAT
jgi:hypothetical protein